MSKLKIFISWSGEQGRLVAEAIHNWLPMMLEGTEPFMSTIDIEKGTEWDVSISKQLTHTRFGIICLTPENRLSPAIHYEAGALSKSSRSKRLWTYLYNLKHSDIKWPLSSFQHTLFEMEDTRKLLRSVNAFLGEHKRDDDVLNKVFDSLWPGFETELLNIPLSTEKAPQRSDRNILEEILELTRVSRNEDETIRLLELHRTSLAHRISPIVDTFLDGIESDPNYFNFDTLLRRIRDAIRKTRMLMKGFQHPRVGDLKDFLERNFTDQQLARFIKQNIEPLMLNTELSTKQKRNKINDKIEDFEARVFEDFYKRLRGNSA